MRLLLLILVSNICFAQQQATQNFISTGPSSFAWNTTSLQSVTDIATCSTALSNTLIIRDTIRGGRFIKYTGSDAADNGMVFSDASGNKWKRATDGYAVNMVWYGTNRSAFTAARDYIYTHSTYKKLYIPAGNYSISDSIHFSKGIIIEGEGVVGYPATQLVFPINKSGLVFSYTVAQGGFGAEVSNISITGQFATPTNTAVHAITVRTRVNFTNIIINQFDGDGFHISACAAQPSGDNNNYGNASTSVLTNISAHYCTNGIFVEGCDASTILFNNIDCSQNRRWGVFDNGFLGNTYIKPHFAFNGAAIAGATTVVKYNNVYYAALYNHDGYFGDATDSNYNKRPDTTIGTYWQVVGTMVESGAWQPNTRYYSGGAMSVKNVNARTEIYSPYTEEFQPPIYLNYRSIVYNGNNGAGVKGLGAWRNMYSGMDMLLNANMYVEKDVEVVGTLTAGNFIGNGAGITGITASATFAGLTGQPTDNANLSTALNGKQAAGTYATGTGSATGVNTGDNATNTQYSGLAASKQDVLVSGTNIKTVNGTTLLGSGDLVVSGAGASRVWLPGDVVNNNAVANTIADVTGLSFPVVAGTKYSFKFFIVYSSAATTTGSRWSINGPATTFIHYRSQYPTTATAITNNTALAGYNLPAASNASSLTTNNIAIIEGIIQPSANGTVIARFASEITASAITAIGGRSYVEYQIIQ